MAFDTQPRYSPDGSKIVFISDRSGADNLWISNADGTEPRAITKDKTQTYRSRSGRRMATTSSPPV